MEWIDHALSAIRLIEKRGMRGFSVDERPIAKLCGILAKELVAEPREMTENNAVILYLVFKMAEFAMIDYMIKECPVGVCEYAQTDLFPKVVKESKENGFMRWWNEEIECCRQEELCRTTEASTR